jgi:zinc transport system permease protein
MQLKKGFTTTLIFAIIFGFVDVMIGLISSYYINSAPGGTIALISVIVLLLTLIFKRFFSYED